MFNVAGEGREREGHASDMMDAMCSLHAAEGAGGVGGGSCVKHDVRALTAQGGVCLKHDGCCVFTVVGGGGGGREGHASDMMDIMRSLHEAGGSGRGRG